jgi:hypothetical protein
MSDRLLFKLSPNWALGHDRHQWIVLRRRNLRTQSGWKALSFIGSTKTTLRRVLKERDVTLTSDAEYRLSEFEERFIDWRDHTSSSRYAA